MYYFLLAGSVQIYGAYNLGKGAWMCYIVIQHIWRLNSVQGASHL